MQPALDPLAQLTEIRTIMERSTRFLSLSGLAGVGVGLVALTGVGVGYWWLEAHFSTDGLSQLAWASEVDRLRLLPFLLTLAGGMIALGFLVAFFFTRRRAAHDGRPLWDGAARRLTISLMAPLIAGGVFCLALYLRGAIALVMPGLLLFYGLALLSASRYTLNEVRFLGYLLVTLGLVGILVPGFGLLLFALGFGLGHIAYGSIMYNRYERIARP